MLHFHEAAVDWGSLGGAGTVAMAVAVISGGVATRVRRWRANSRVEDHEIDLLRIAVFGRQADGPLPAIPGVIKALAETDEAVIQLRSDVDQLQRGVETLVARTQPNGGKSIPDQLNRIMKHLGIEEG